jgi:hypothetical protein
MALLQYGAALGGLNGAPAELSERTLREFYLHSWRAFAKVRRAVTAPRQLPPPPSTQRPVFATFGNVESRWLLHPGRRQGCDDRTQ